MTMMLLKKWSSAPALLMLVLSLFSTQVAAQTGWELGGGGGIAYYFGDLNTQYNLEHPGLSTQALVRYNFNDRLAWRLGASYMRIEGNDQWSSNAFQQRRNLNVRTPIWDFNSGIEFNFLEFEHGGDKFFTPYLYGGIGVYRFDPEALHNGQYVKLRELGTEGQFYGEEYYATQGSVAFGGGMKLSFKYYWMLNIELSGRRLFTDYLDDVSTTYPDMGDLASLRGLTAVSLSDPSLGPDQIGAEGRQRGDSKTRDTYAFFNVSIMYFFGDIHCPKFH
jgi:Domain of unknown function (DUF6089)